MVSKREMVLKNKSSHYWVQGLALAAFMIGLAVQWISCRDVPNKLVRELGVDLPIQKKKLSNGLQFVLVEDHTVPVISYQTWFRVGSVDERPGITGISHLFEHLMFKGTQKFPEKSFFLELEAKGAEVNAYTTRDYTVYYETFIPSLIDKVIEMEADRMENLLLTDSILQIEKQVVMEERRLRTDNSPAGKMQEALWALAFRRHPYAWPVIGIPDDLDRINSTDLMNYYKKHYHPSNAVVVVVGDFNTNELFEKLKRYYGKLEAKPIPFRDPPREPEQNEERRLTLYDDVISEQFMEAYPITSAQDSDSYAIDVLSNILFEGNSSRAYRKLVEELNITLGVSGSSFTPTFPGLLLISGIMKGDLKSAQAEEAIEKLIQEIQENSVTQEEVQKAVRQLTVQLVDSIRTPFGVGQLIGTVMMIFQDPYRFSEDLKKYFKVTPLDVQRVAQKYLIPNNRSVVKLLPETKRKKAK